MLAKTPTLPPTTTEAMKQRIEDLLASGMDGREVTKTMEEGGCEIVSNLSGWVGLRLGDNTVYHPKLA